MISQSNLNKIYRLRDAFIKRYTGLTFMPSQQRASNRIIKATLEANGELIPMEFSRQSGKTTCVCGTTAFLMVNYHRLMKALNKPTTPKFQVVLAAPIQDQVVTDFDRIKEFLNNVKKDGQLPSFDSYNGNTIRFGDVEAYCFSASPGSHPESKTANLLIVEEAQDCDDLKLNKAFHPMTANTNGPAIYIGTAGYSRCEYKRLIDRGGGIIMPYDAVVRERRLAFEETSNPLLLNYEKHCQNRVETLGFDNDEFKTQYRLIWVLERGQLITEEQLYRLEGDYERGAMRNNTTLVAGIDWGKVNDSTVVTIMDSDYRVIDWLELQGDNYDEQMAGIIPFLERYKPRRIYCDATATQDMMVDWLRKKCRGVRLKTTVEGVKFTAPEKDNMFKLMVKAMIPKLNEDETVVAEGVLRYPCTDCMERRRFINQFLECEKEERNNMVRWHAPEEPNAHDDYIASLALALMAVRDINKSFIKFVEYGSDHHYVDDAFNRKPY